MLLHYEFENIDYEGLKRLTEIAYVPQGAELVRITQNRVTEKDAIVKAGCPVCTLYCSKYIRGFSEANR